MKKKGRPGIPTISDEQNKKNLEEKKKKEEELKNYQKYYKDILWIDDDSGNTTIEKINWLKEGISYNNDSLYSIETVKSFIEAVEKINDNSYDLVIFDINLENGFKDLTDLEIQEIKIEDTFKKYNIKFKYIDFPDNEVNKKTAGEYLYLLLLSTGYPKDRMIICTNNYKDFQEYSNLSKSGLFDFSCENKLFIPKKDKNGNTQKICIDSYFNDCNLYYRIRRLVYQACNFWEEKLSNPNYEIPFNELYDLKIEKENFENMLKQIKMMFPVIKPSNPEEVYYQAMHVISMFHEEKANIKNKIKGKANIYPYHQIIRHFRNWSSHNKFEEHNKFNAKQFAFLFCIALRTYFDTQKFNSDEEDKYYLNKECYYYEELYFSDFKEKSMSWENVHKKIESIQEEILNKINFYSNKKLIEDITFSESLQNLGFEDCKMPFWYINLLMFKSPFSKFSKPILKKSKDKSIIIYSSKCKKNEVKSSQFTNKIEENEFNINEFFEKIAFSLLE